MIKHPSSKQPITDKDWYALLYAILKKLEDIDKNTAVHQSPG